MSADPWLLAPPRGLSRPAAPFVASVSHRHPPCALVHSLAARRIAADVARPRSLSSPRASARAVSLESSRLSLFFLCSARTGTSSPCASLDLPHPVNEPTPPVGGGLVEDVGLEPTTPGLQSLCSSRLSQSPMIAVVPGRLELPTPTLSVWCSNRLSYGTPASGLRPRDAPKAGASIACDGQHGTSTVPAYPPERRCSSRTFRYGYLVTT